MPNIRIAQAQINPVVGDLKANASFIVRDIKRARAQGASLVTFPELAVCGYPPEDLLIKPRFISDCAKTLEGILPHTRDIICVVGYPKAEDGKLYNAAAVLYDGQIKAEYRKIELPNYGVFDEMRYFTPGGGCQFVELDEIRIMLTICEDLWIEGNLCEQAAKGCAPQICLNISASPFHMGKYPLRRGRIVGGFARRTSAWVLHNNLVGGQDELVFDGGSVVADPQGNIVACARRFAEDLLISDLNVAPEKDLADLLEIHRHMKPWPAVMTALGSPAPKNAKTDISIVDVPDLDKTEEVHQALVLGTRDYVRKNGFKKVVLGLSGGIDSALTAAIAVEALGAENVKAVTMPSQFTSGETLGDAGELAKNLGIELTTIPIKAMLDCYLKELAGPLGGGDLGVAGENLQARIRGNILMALSNHFGYLVLTTGNKSETAVGYCTLYGDTAGGFAVIKDLPKTLVYEVSEYINRRADRELIPQSTIERPPTAELRPEQKDTDSLPPYEVLDPILKAYVEQDLVQDQIVELGFDSEVVGRVARLVDLNEYKRRQAAPGVKITPKAFGKDRRLPITNHYRPGQN